MEMQFAYGSNMDSDRLKQKGIERILENAKIARLDDWEFGFTKKSDDESGKANIIPMTGSIVWGLLLDCLLYTSPSPRDRSLSRMPSSA